MRALVTGGAGFIGSNLVDALLDRGDEVAVVDDLSTGRRENLDGALHRGVVLHEADIRDAPRLREVFVRARPDIVFHLAAQMDVRRSIEDPAFDAGINVLGTINVLEAARASGVRRVINTSTGGAIYGEVDVMPTPESVTPKPMAAYGQSKFCAEAYCGWFERLHGLSSVTLRYGNVYGPRQDPQGEAGVIAIFAGRLLAGEQPTIYGDGRQTRDYTYVGDIVAANLAAAAHPEAHGSYNVGTGVESSVLEILAALRAAAGVPEQDFEPRFAPGRKGELQRSSLDVTRARAELGFTADTDLVSGMKSTLDWARASVAS
ncbi:MAG: UDP-glucose 4-epimerase [Solirubrobacteraceae bacterium]|jgi:UDP-glucose 4-epimerase|nr:UDP-glucose 4-epimerase [Solirubrobacteraceae bacterium]